MNFAQLRCKGRFGAVLAIAILVGSYHAQAGFEEGASAYKQGDYVAAAKEYEKAAREGNVNAQAILGQMYSEGLGVVQDYSQAVKWFELAAAQGHTVSRTVTAYFYDTGKGVAVDKVKSLKLYKLSAEEGDILAQFNLGIKYAEGDGVPQDFVMSHKYFSLVATGEDGKAAKMRDQVETQMTAQQIAESKRLVSNWRADHSQAKALTQQSDVPRKCDLTLEANKKYVEQHQHPDGTVKVLPGCPGYDDTDPGYGNFWLNGIEFRIPRDYLTLNREEADGATAGIFLMFSVPRFEPTTAMGPNQIVENATITSTEPEYYCHEEQCYSFIEMVFFEYITGLQFKRQPKAAVIGAHEILSHVERKPERKGYYLLSGEGFEAAFHEKDGVILEWYFCGDTEGHCISRHLLDGKLLVYLSLRQATLRQMIKFKTLFYTKLLDQFVVGESD